MQVQRLKILEQFLLDDPKDPFNTYALAMEYLSLDSEKSLRLLESLYENHPDYLPAYYQLAHLYMQTDNQDKVNEVFNRGISLARDQENAKALRELQGAFQQFKDEQEEW